MRICIYGAGAIGGSLAVRLMGAGAEVSVIARGDHGRAIRQRGLRLLSAGREFHEKPFCVEDPRHLPPQDLVFVTMKWPQVAAVARLLPGMLAEGGRVVFAMNGVPWWFGSPLPEEFAERLDPDHALRKAVKPRQLICAVIYSSNEVIEPGVVGNSTPQRNRVVLGTPDDKPDAGVGALVEMLRRAGYEAAATTSIRREIWSKMLLVVGAAPVSALTGRNLRDLVGDPEARGLMAAIMRESLMIGRRLGFDLADDVDQRLDFYRDTPARPSLLQDFEAGREPELDSGILAVCAIAAAVGLKVPAMETVATLVRMKIKGDLQ